MFRKSYPDVKILNFCRPNEDSAQLKDTISDLNLTPMDYAALVKYSMGFVTIDSSMMHICSNRYTEKIGVCLFGSSSPKQFGYIENINLSVNGKHSRRPLPKTLCDLYSKENNLFLDDMSVMEISPTEIMFAVDHMVSVNSKRGSIDYSNYLNEFKRISIPESLKTVFLNIRNQQNQHEHTINTIIKQYLDSLGLVGNYMLSKDLTQLVKIPER